ncbi:MAG: Cys-tRNA(Pro) deacylase [Actinomycetia bacterium]|nr:Cys-tRNA(Pro) deacylase [Actinomycetes bacterium]MCH9800532.1 Cys-tRNA(Pro) deacylase [Actinomycetes bacterium]
MDLESAAEADPAGESGADSPPPTAKSKKTSGQNKKSVKSGKSGSKKKVGKGATPATQLLEERGYSYALHVFQHDPANSNYGKEAVDRLNADPRRVFKTLIVDVGNHLTAALIPVSASLDLRALAAALGVKRAEMAEPATVERATGYRLGAISPLGMKQQIPVVIDDSSADADFMLISGGRRGLELELRVRAVVDLVDARLAPIAR